MKREAAEYRFVQRMHALRTGLGWSHERLSTELKARGYHMAPSSVTKLEWALNPAREDAARNLRLNDAEAIARVFGLRLEQMVGDTSGGITTTTTLTASGEVNLTGEATLVTGVARCVAPAPIGSGTADTGPAEVDASADRIAVQNRIDQAIALLTEARQLNTIPTTTEAA